MAKALKPNEIITELISAEDVLDPESHTDSDDTDSVIDPLAVIDDAYENEKKHIENKIKEINNCSERPSLKDTVELMVSASYKERFIAEYMQVKIRYNNLHNMMIKLDAGTLDFEPDCDRAILEDQCYYMGNYIRVLRIRAEIENIPLPRI